MHVHVHTAHNWVCSHKVFTKSFRRSNAFCAAAYDVAGGFELDNLFVVDKQIDQRSSTSPQKLGTNIGQQLLG